MATRGSNPGERRGGRKKGTPNKKLTPRDVHTLARARAIQEELEDHRPPPGTESDRLLSHISCCKRKRRHGGYARVSTGTELQAAGCERRA